MGATQRIITKLVPEWVQHQIDKSADYNTTPLKSLGETGPAFENADVLGLKGQFADIWRKIWKLKKSLWDDEILLHEQPREILMDLIGHCFLAIDMIDRQAAATEAPPVILGGKGPEHGYDGCPACQAKRITGGADHDAFTS